MKTFINVDTICSIKSVNMTENKDYIFKKENYFGFKVNYFRYKKCINLNFFEVENDYLIIDTSKTVPKVYNKPFIRFDLINGKYIDKFFIS